MTVEAETEQTEAKEFNVEERLRAYHKFESGKNEPQKQSEPVKEDPKPVEQEEEKLEADSGNEGKEPETDDSKKKPSKAEKRINELHRKWKEEEERRVALEERLNKLENNATKQEQDNNVNELRREWQNLTDERQELLLRLDDLRDEGADRKEKKAILREVDKLDATIRAVEKDYFSEKSKAEKKDKKEDKPKADDKGKKWQDSLFQGIQKIAKKASGLLVDGKVDQSHPVWKEFVRLTNDNASESTTIKGLQINPEYDGIKGGYEAMMDAFINVGMTAPKPKQKVDNTRRGEIDQGFVTSRREPSLVDNNESDFDKEKKRLYAEATKYGFDSPAGKEYLKLIRKGKA